VGSGKGGVCCYKGLDVVFIFFNQQLHSSLLPLPLLPPAFTIPSILNNQFKALPAAIMAKGDSKKRAEMMAKEWKKSRITTRSLNDIVGMGLLHN